MRRRRRPTLHHAVKDKRVTVLGPVKQPEMDFMSHRGLGPGTGPCRSAPRRFFARRTAPKRHSVRQPAAPEHVVEQQTAGGGGGEGDWTPQEERGVPPPWTPPQAHIRTKMEGGPPPPGPDPPPSPPPPLPMQVEA